MGAENKTLISDTVYRRSTSFLVLCKVMMYENGDRNVVKYKRLTIKISGHFVIGRRIGTHFFTLICIIPASKKLDYTDIICFHKVSQN